MTEARQVDDSDYKIYTTDFDQEVFASELTVDSAYQWKPLATGEYDQFLDDIAEAEQELERLLQLAEPKVAQLKRQSLLSEAGKAVTLLLDHSGSLRVRGSKRGYQKAFLLANLFACCARALGVPHEILGFTTSEWRGGQARTQWQREGGCSNPGRLCPILHIVYSEFDDSGVPDMRALLRPDLLKENVDGEAVLWAAQRMSSSGMGRQDLIVVSDGAPVDDSTLSANGERYLWDHLKAVLVDLKKRGDVQLHGVGIEHDLSKLYPNTIRVDEASDLTTVALPFFEKVLTELQ